MSNNRFTIESHEALIWQDTPSQFVNLKHFALFGLGFLISLSIATSYTFVGLIGMLAFAFLIFDKYVEARDTKYDLTHERLKFVLGGVLTGRQTYEIDIDDLFDVKLNETYIQQLFKIGTIVLEFKGDPLLTSYRDLVKKEKHNLIGIHNPHRSYEIIRAAIKKTLNKQSLTLEQYNLNLEKQNPNKPKLLR
jgi:uncharacterized membrane protein YdbT with pleckstrin-like domain